MSDALWLAIIAILPQLFLIGLGSALAVRFRSPIGDALKRSRACPRWA